MPDSVSDLPRGEYIRDRRVANRMAAQRRHIDANPPVNNMSPEEQLAVNRRGMADVRGILEGQKNRRMQGRLDGMEGY